MRYADRIESGALGRALDEKPLTPAEMEEELASKSRFGCSKCGEEFASIKAVYDHLDEEHN